MATTPTQFLNRLEAALRRDDLQLANSLCLELKSVLDIRDREECLELLDRVRGLERRARTIKGTLRQDLKTRSTHRTAASAYRATPLAGA